MRYIPVKIFIPYYRKAQMSSYTTRHRTYYENHRPEIAQKEQEKKRWLNYYEANKESVKARNLARYHNRKNINSTMPTINQFFPVTEVTGDVPI